MNQEISKTQGGKGQIRKIQKNKKERMEERKRRDFFPICGGSHTCVFFIGQEHPRATLPQENPLVWEPPLQHKAHSYASISCNVKPQGRRILKTRVHKMRL
jgi:hypothetical protein